MIKSILIEAIVIFFSLTSFSQKVGITLEKNNTLYVDIDNPITIVVEKESCKNLIIKTDNGSITGADGTYDCRPNSIGPANINVYINQSGNIKKIKTLSFRVKYYVPIENIQFQFGHCSNNCKMTIIELKQLHFVGAYVANMDFDYKYPVDSFKVEIKYKDSLKTFKNIGNKLSQELVTEFALLNENSEILFTDIHSHRPVTGSIIILSPIKLFITE